MSDDNEFHICLALDDRQETSLIEIMVCCVKQAATGESPVGRGPNRKVNFWLDLSNIHKTNTDISD